MAEERIAERIDANLMNVSMEDLHDLPKNMFEDKIERLCKETNGKLIIKEYPTASAHSAHFRGLIKELAIKRSFKPDMIFIDYLNICASQDSKEHLMLTLTHILNRLQKNLEVLPLSVMFQSCLRHKQREVDSPRQTSALRTHLNHLGCRRLPTSCSPSSRMRN